MLIEGVESISVVNPYFPNERAQQWNVSVGREFLGTAIDVAYVGTKTPFDPARRLYQRFSSVSLVEAGGQAIYHGLTIQADRKMARGLWFNANYAFGKALTDVDLRNYAQTVQQNQWKITNVFLKGSSCCPATEQDKNFAVMKRRVSGRHRKG